MAKEKIHSDLPFEPTIFTSEDEVSISSGEMTPLFVELEGFEFVENWSNLIRDEYVFDFSALDDYAKYLENRIQNPEPKPLEMIPMSERWYELAEKLYAYTPSYPRKVLRDNWRIIMYEWDKQRRNYFG